MTPRPSPTTIHTIIKTLTKQSLNHHLFPRPFSTTTTTMAKTFKVAKTSDLKDGQMKEVDIPGAEGKVLLSRVKGEFYATGAKCTRRYFGGRVDDRLWRTVEKWSFDGERTTCLSLARYFSGWRLM
jgi:nitrite reductase/ring-hydroxylating ferredoxin subunit